MSAHKLEGTNVNALDEVHLAKSIVLTVWMALKSPDACEADLKAIADVLYEAHERLLLAQIDMGMIQ
ncbi:MAG: hypothetical protein CML29_05040 [Rhizobiales bacterium]|nr:hypothetical protein [Hyphomicrobiales bacterium]MBA71020.1 hypothetical protein [Hyphomicrobiales bacterium]|tara:strand:+ start:1770 stop:1970 length:201 start_codon:yes stop_codon:yes gene_type:complete